MGNPYFKFKQFTVHHDRCAMKVGMDGSLLGAWAGAELHPSRILDIGTGTGLIALMCAQRYPDAEITGIDIQSTCVNQAKENVANSPFSSRITIEVTPVQYFNSSVRFDLIVCNPPFFNRSSQSGQSDRDTARHDDNLSFPDLAKHAVRLLNKDGIFSLIIPEDRASEFMAIAESEGLHLVRSVKVRGRIGGVVKRRLLEFSPSYPIEAPHLDELAVEADIKIWTEEYKSLLRDFYVVL